MSAFSVFTSFKAKDGVTPVFRDMARRGNEFQEQITGVSKSFNKAFQGISNGLTRVKTGFSNFTAGIFTLKNAVTAVVAGSVVKSVLSAGQSFVDMASDLVETRGKIDVVFGSMSDSVHKWAQSSIKNMGLAQQTALDNAALFGDMGVGMDIPVAKAAEMAMSLTQLGADLASFKNISNDVAKNALKSVYTGETESLKELGVVMTQATLQEFARSRGIQKKISAMKTAEMVELRYQYVLAKTKTAQGDFLRTGGNAANQMRVYNETLKEIKTNFGMVMLPEYTKILTKVNKLLEENMPVIQKTFEDMYSGVKSLCGIFVNLYGILQGIKTHSDLVVAALSGIATVALIANFNNIAWAVLGLAMQMGTLTASTWASVTAFAAQTAALLANPMTWIAIGIGAVVAGLVLLAMNWDKVKNAAINFVQVAKDKISELWEKVAPVFNKIAELARKVFQFTPLGMVVNATRVIKDKFEGPKDAATAQDVPAFAAGTPNFSGGLALVGEKGPELVSLPPRTQIFSNKNTIDIFKNSAIEKYNNVIKIEDYLTEKTVSFNKEHIKNNNEVREDNVIYLEIELDAPEGYDAKVVNARSSSGKEFKVKLRGKRKQ